ncbi:trypsin-like peptidase domain-containing protein [Variovorax sp. AFSI2.2]|uniref:trypsin-like peptidase domain-containing protein n=1 Tax=Variovorax sp. AFSI2.2 TaxID=3384160 RepID=UPI003EB84D46
MLIDRDIVADIERRWKTYGGDKLPARDHSAKGDATRSPVGAEASSPFWAARGLQPSADGKAFSAMAAAVPSVADGLSLPPDTRAERILGSSDLMEIVFLEAALRVAGTVARVRVNGSSGALLGYGTGFLVSPRLLLTNWHVLKTADIARVSIAEFGYQTQLGDGAPRPGHVFRLEPQRFFLSDQTLDFALVAVSETATDDHKLASIGYNRLVDDDETLIAKGQFSNIIQHPSGQPKQIAFRQNEVIEKPGDFLHYRTDTAPGSSGAPVYNDQWQVVALHRAGVWATNDAGQILAVDGSVWRNGMPEDRIRWLANEGTRVPRLLAWWRNPGPAQGAGDYLDELVAPDVPSVLDRREALAAPVTTPPAAALFATPAAAPVYRRLADPSTDPLGLRAEVASDGTATWTIPLRVSVALGDIAANARAAVPDGPAGLAVVPAPSSALPVAPAATDLASVLARAKEALMAGRNDVIGVRAGWVFDESGITDQRALVATVRRKRTTAELMAAGVTELPRTFEGYPVEVMGPSVEDFLRMSVGPARTEALLAARVTPEEITYVPPPDLDLASVTDTMRVKAHVSPDAGWPVLREFIQAARTRLVGAMYEFTADHIRLALTETAQAPQFEELTLVLDSARGSIRNAPTVRDSDAMVRDLRNALGDKLRVAWVKLGSVRGWVNHDYHIKVLIRDDEALWLSSGNWKGSSQPDADPVNDIAALRELLDENNREWHAVIEHPGLAQTYQTAVRGDFDANRDTRPEEFAGLPELWFVGGTVPRAEEGLAAVTYFAPFDETRQFTVQPILTPDNYLDIAIPAIKAARKSILVQNQSLSVPPQQADGRYIEFWNTLLSKQRRGLDVRLIFRLQDRDPTGGRVMFEALKDYGFDAKRIRIQRGCHTKGLIIDGKRVMLGSHNLTNMGATTNRDASLLFDDEPLAQYFTGLFVHDWENVAEPLSRRHWRNSELRTADEVSPEEGFQPFEWKAWLEGA